MLDEARLAELKRLSVEERLLLIEVLAGSLVEESSVEEARVATETAPGLPPGGLAALQRRLTAWTAGRLGTVTWQEFVDAAFSRRAGPAPREDSQE